MQVNQFEAILNFDTLIPNGYDSPFCSTGLQGKEVNLNRFKKSWGDSSLLHACVGSILPKFLFERDLAGKMTLYNRATGEFKINPMFISRLLRHETKGRAF